jgi:hypothetical protein
VAALLLSFAQRNDLVMDNSGLWDLLVDHVDNHYAQNPGFSGQLGSGRLNAYLALTFLQDMISGVMNPGSFSAIPAGTGQIDLSWEKNNENDDVMIIWSGDGVFGQPAAGIEYNSGNTIPGGGTVIYLGGDTLFSHTGLDAATMYYYKAYSYNATNEYSSGVIAHVATFCNVFSSLPVLEDFNLSANIPFCWEVIDHQGNGQGWQIGTHAGGLEGTTGNYAFLNSDAYGSGNSQNSDLVSPLMDLSGFTNIQLAFTHYFRQYTGSSATLSYSLNNGTNWVNLQTWNATTANPAIFALEISELANQPSVRFKWNYTGTWGYYWDVDDIVITGAISGPHANFFADTTSAIPGEVITFTDASGGSSFSSWEWSFGDGAEPEFASGEGPHEVFYRTYGSKTISLIADGVYTATKTGYVNIIPAVYTSGAAYTTGDISSDYNFQTGGQSSSCPGLLTVSMPENATVNAVDVSYEMTALNNGWKSEQRSQLRCTSPGGLSEIAVYEGTGNTEGTQTYERIGLSIANNVSGSEDLLFQLHAGRTWGGSDCNEVYNKVDNNTWEVTVHYSFNNSYTIAAIPNNPNSGTISGEGVLMHGEIAVLTASPLPGYEFINWIEDGTIVSESETYVFVALENRNLVANFIPLVPAHAIVQNENIGFGDIFCFDATETIIANDLLVEEAESCT